MSPESEPQIQLHRRPGKLKRDKYYPAFTAYEGVSLLPGTMPIYLYLRRSRYHRDEDGGDTIERHRLDLTRQLAVDGRWTAMGEYVDNDSASASAARTRRGWHLLNQAIESNEVKAVAFWKLDRTNRDAAQILIWLARCRQLGVTLVSNQDAAAELNTAAGSAKIAVGVKALFAEVETDTMSERQLNSKRHLAEAGFHHGGQVPFGWTVGPRVTDQHGRSGRRLAPHEIEHPALKVAVEMVLAGHSLRAICNRWKDDLGIVTADGHRIPSNHLLRYLRSPRVVGYRPYQVPDHTRGERLNLMEYVIKDAEGNPVLTQEPVCDRVTWTRMLRELESRTKNPRGPWKANSASDWVLTGLLRCPGCGRNLYGYWSRPKGAKTRYYTCRANSMFGSSTCQGGVAVRADDADAYVLGWIAAVVTQDRLDAIRTEFAAKAARNGPIAGAVRALEDLRGERDELLTRQGSGEFRGPMISVLVDMLADVMKRIDNLEERLDALQPPEVPTRSGEELIRGWPDLTLSQKRAALGAVISGIEVTRGREAVENRLTVVPKYAQLDDYLP